MLSNRLAAFALLVGLLATTPADATLLRVEMASDAVDRFPQTFEALQERVAAAGLTVTWSDAPIYDPYYSGAGGATYGSMSVQGGGFAEASISWIEFDTPGAAQQYETELNAASSTYAVYYAFRRRGRVMIHVYSHSGVTTEAEAMLTRILSS